MVDQHVLDSLLLISILPAYILVIGFIYLYSFTSNTYEQRVKKKKNKRS